MIRCGVAVAGMIDIAVYSSFKMRGAVVDVVNGLVRRVVICVAYLMIFDHAGPSIRAYGAGSIVAGVARIYADLGAVRAFKEVL